MLFSEPPQAFRLKAENTAAVINAVIGFIGFPSWAGKRPSENGFQTALNYSGSDVWTDLPTNKRQNPCRYGHRANLLQEVPLPCGSDDFVGSGIRSGSLLRQTAVQPSTKFSGLPKKGRLKTIHSVFRRPFCRFTLLPIQIRTSRGSRRLRPRRFSRRRGLWAGRAFSSCCRTGRR